MPTKKESECFQCPGLDKREIEALKALSKGEADEYQQKLSLSIIVNKFSRSHDSPYIPGSFDQSSFIAGRAFVGQKILKYLKVPIGKLIQQKDEETSDEND